MVVVVVVVVVVVAVVVVVVVVECCCYYIYILLLSEPDLHRRVLPRREHHFWPESCSRRGKTMTAQDGSFVVVALLTYKWPILHWFYRVPEFSEF